MGIKSRAFAWPGAWGILVVAFASTLWLTAKTLRPEQATYDAIVVASADPDGEYHASAMELCAAFNGSVEQGSEAVFDSADPPRPVCTIETTAGSKDNVKGLMNGAFDGAFVQSNVFAVSGVRDLTCDAPTNLGGVGSLTIAAWGPQEVLHVIVRADNQADTIETFLDAALRRAEETGDPVSDCACQQNAQPLIYDADGEGSGSQEAAKILLERFPEELREERGWPNGREAKALCDGQIDVVFKMIAPSTNIFQTERGGCRLKALALGDEVVRRLIAADRGFSQARLETDVVASTPIASIGVHPLFVVSHEKADQIDAAASEALCGDRGFEGCSARTEDFCKVAYDAEGVREESATAAVAAPPR
ncbi:MAG: hypothetical protein ACFB6S_19975 [Geminicoccaceae bacterium]